jgi:hypothetical protein
MAVLIYIPTNSVQGFFSPTSLSRLYFIPLIVILTNVTYLIIFNLYFSSNCVMLSKFNNLYIHTHKYIYFYLYFILTFCMSWEMPVQILCPFYNKIISCLTTKFELLVYFRYEPLTNTWFGIFPFYKLSSLFIISFAIQKLFGLINITCLCFLLFAVFGNYIWKLIAHINVKKLFLMFSSSSFIVSNLMLK